MDKVMSARLDEEAIAEMELVTRRLQMTKKQFLEQAIRLHARALADRAEVDVWNQTHGSWKRRERPATTAARARRAFKKSFERRYHR